MIEELVKRWNNEWRFDYIYRRKYKIAFNSTQHRELNPIDVKFDILEERLMLRERKLYRKRESDLEEYRLSGNWLNKTKQTKKERLEEDDLFGSIGITGE